ncbi:DUF11 domain-containing protein [bacterium]|nr:DUF11 domain-containing protein [bacterium]
MNRKTIFLLITLAAFGFTALMFAAGTPAGTTISNIAYGGYSDANGNVIADVDDSTPSSPTERISSGTVEIEVAQKYGLDVSPDDAQDIPRNGTVTYAVTVENTGNGNDTIGLSQVTTPSDGSTFTVHIYHDTDGDGVWDGAGTEPEVASTGVLVADATYDLVVVVSVTDGVQGETGTTVVTGTSSDGTTTETATLVSTVQAALITGTLAPDATSKAPGDIITYTVTINNSNDTDSETAYNVRAYLPVPANCTWVGNVTGGSDPGGAGTSTVTGSDIAAGGSATITYQVQVNAGVSAGTTIDNQVDVDYQDSTGDDYTQVNLYANAGTGGRITVSETTSFTTAITPASQSGDPGDEIVYRIAVNNTGNGDDSYEISLNSSTQSWTWTYYRDDGDGTWEGSGTETLDTNTGAVSSGGTAYMWAVRTIAAGTDDETEDVSVFRMTSDDDSNETSDETGTTTVTAPILSLSKSVAVVGGGDAVPEATLRYTITIDNSGTGDASDVIIKDAIPAHTSYDTGTMTIDGSGVTDADDSPVDESQYDTSGSPTCIFGVGTVAAGASIDCTFDVIID